jgi:hypothetical protein
MVHACLMVPWVLMLEPWAFLGGAGGVEGASGALGALSDL